MSHTNPSARLFLMPALAAGLLLPVGERRMAGADPLAGAITLRRGPHLLLDDFLIETSDQVTRRVNSPQRDLPGPVITAREDGNFQPYVTVIRDPQTGRFRVWYDVPEDAGRSHLATMASTDGIHWERPHLVLPDPAPIQFGASVLDEGPASPDPQRRYKFGWWMDGGLQVAGSPDGLAWKPLAPGVVLRHDHDINSLFRDPIRNRYLAMVSSYGTGPDWRGKRRFTMQSVSDDLVHWASPWPVITPEDGKDEGEMQFYCMAGLLARGDLLIGTLKVLRDDLPADAGGPAAGIGYTVLAWSRDGRTWTRDRTPYFDRNPERGSWDHAMAWMDCQLPVGDQVYCYYGGYARGHKVERFTERQIGLVHMRRDRYVARAAGATPGRIRTPLLNLEGERLALNLDARAGELRAQLLDDAGRPISGFAFADAPPISSDALAAPVRWKRPLRDLKGKPVRLELSLRNAALFALELQ
jgi:hypothetical protein